MVEVTGCEFWVLVRVKLLGFGGHHNVNFWLHVAEATSCVLSGYFDGGW